MRFLKWPYSNLRTFEHHRETPGTQAGGEIYIVPAIGSTTREDTETYRKSLMRFDLDIPLYEDKKTPIDVLLTKIDNFVKPDYIFIDTRSGIHQIGGITLSRYSDLAMLFFYGSNQNVQGMKTTIPILKKENTPFVLLNVKVPVNAELAELEKKGTVLVLRPSQHVKISRVEKNPDKLQALYEVGIRDAQTKQEQIMC